MVWRPEGWPERPCNCDDTWCLQCSEWRDREAGADAMLAALRGKAVSENHVDGEWVYVHMRVEDIKGYTVVFIPDAPERQLPDRCDSCPPLKMGWSGGKKYCGVCGWLIVESWGMPNSEARKRMEEIGASG